MKSIEVYEMDDKFLEDVSARFRLLAHPVRVKILAKLEKKRLSVKELQDVLGLPQAAVSQHLHAMRSVGLLAYERNGKQHIYYVKDKSACGILRCIEKVYVAAGKN